MTENEALEILNNECEDVSKVQVALKVAREALEEIQAYRAIGTVEDIQLIFSLCKDLERIVKKYEIIGTIEEFKALKEKSVAKKPKMIGYRKDGEPVYECGCCGSTLKVADQPFCMICSCKVDWQ